MSYRSAGFGFIVILALAFGLALLSGFCIMLLFGMLYHEFHILKPLGFWASSGLGALLSAVLNRGRN